jgi:hypothetical protein
MINIDGSGFFPSAKPISQGHHRELVEFGVAKNKNQLAFKIALWMRSAVVRLG